jgi:hypothetical protein
MRTGDPDRVPLYPDDVLVIDGGGCGMYPADEERLRGSALADAQQDPARTSPPVTT